MTKKKCTPKPTRPRRVQVYQNPGQSLTEQHHARACDINTIMARYVRDGVLTHMNDHAANYGDISELDFKESMDTIRAVEQEFADLPAYVRAHYQQDASKYLMAISTPEGVENLRSLKPPAMAYEKDGSRDTEALAASRGTDTGEEGDSAAVT